MSDLIRSLQEKAVRAVPAEHVAEAEGWLLRHSPGCAWWVGTAVAHGDLETDAMRRGIAAVEEFYAARGVRAAFQITPGATPQDLDRVLGDRGYRIPVSVSLQEATTEQVRELAPAGSLHVRLDERPTREWFEAWHAVAGGDARAQWGMLERVTQPSAYASASIGDEVVAVGRAVAEAGWAGVYGMATLPRARGKGAAGAVLGALADWAAVTDNSRMYLQVEHSNETAIRLYQRVGFTELCVFHIRVADPAE